MRKGDMRHRWDDEDIRQLLLDEAGKEPVPESLRPENMEAWLRQACSGRQETPAGDAAEEDEKGNGRKQGKHSRRWYGAFAAAACIALALFAAGRYMDWDLTSGDEKAEIPADDAADDDGESAEEGAFEEGTTYAKLYQAFDKYWSKEEEWYRSSESYAMDDTATDDAATDAAADDAEMDTADMDVGESSSGGMEYAESVIEDGMMKAEGSEAAGAADDADMAEGGEAAGEEDYGKTNQQEEAVEEADILKNDGRYLYWVSEWKGGAERTVRIIDTKGGLKEAAQVGKFDGVEDIYVWKDKLAVIEPSWATGAVCGDYSDPLEPVYSYSRVYIYDISDRTNPKEYHTFTMKGDYMDSRISDGYLYLFVSCDTSKPKSQEDLRAYVPMLDGKPIQEDRITFPEESEADSYLVMASVDMERPDKFTDTRALVTSADRFYVSQSSIYVADTQYISYQEAGRQSDSTVLYRYSYKDGKMRKEARGTVKGTLRDDMAMNEYQGHLRLVTTVQSEDVMKIVDDITGEFLGYDDAETKTTNSLYVLDAGLETVGKIEGLAEDERVYSARFMGNIGYFVTFRETDPLFSVDLSDPRNPKILGELKISGFSEYLHFYADNLLLGIGMEADEETGMAGYLKLSMFDISNPADVKEQFKMELSGFEYSDALYDYKAVLIDTKKNLFGFSAEDFEEEKTMYLLFTFENGEFRKVMEIDCSDYDRYGYGFRGTYIGERFFLLADNGLVEEYSLADGSKTGALEP